MAHFAKINENGLVTDVVVVNDSEAPTEQAGVDFLNTVYKTNDVWKQTSYNTRSGIYYTPSWDRDAPRVVDEDQSKAFRANFAGIGGHYDQEKDIFVGSQPYDSWSSYNDVGEWICPIPTPTSIEHNGEQLITTYDDANQRFVGALGTKVINDISDFNLYWDSSTETWNDIVS
jgi:hypothetical protein|tara:strand:- start:1883 stop:2401 length:519 start_codon:yes stop_codon:yes gene_type:complete